MQMTSGFRDSRRLPWISLISFGYIEVDFVVDEWISWISLFRQWISLISQWIS